LPQQGDLMETYIALFLCALAAPALSAEPAFKWVYSENKDEMRGTVTHMAGLQSTNMVAFDFPYDGGSSLVLMVRNNPNVGKDVMLMITKGQFHCPYEGCEVVIRFDDEKPKSYKASHYEGGTPNAINISPYKALVQSLKKHKRMIIEAPFFQAGRRQFTFTLEPALEWKH
jgi:hypothetical protein